MAKKLYRACVTYNGNKVWLSAHTKRELEEKKVLARQEFITGVASRQMTFHQLMDEWFTYIYKPVVKQTTAKSTQFALRRIRSCIDYRKLCRAITRKDLQEVINRGIADDISYSSLSRIKTVLSSICRYGVEERQMQSNVAESLNLGKQKDGKHREAIPPQDIALIMEAARGKPIEKTIMLLYYTGMRSGEVRALLWSDIDIDARTISVTKTISGSTATTTKTPAGNRIIHMPPQLVDYLRPLRQHPSAYVSEYQAYRSLFYAWGALLFSCGLATERPRASKKDQRYFYTKYQPHCLRHTYITMLYDAGVDAVAAQRIVGHKNYSTTANTYTHITEQRKASITEKIDTMFPTAKEQKSDVL